MKVLGWVLLAGLVPPPGATEKLLKEAKLSLSEAIEKGGKDGAPVGVRLTEEKGRLVYHVRMASGETSTRFAIDARTGELVEKAAEKKSYAKALAVAKLSVAKATEAALKKVPGKAYGVKLEMDKGKAVYEIRVLAGAKRHEVEVDAVTGAILDDEDEDDDDDDDDDDEDDDD
jgi:uncharacterized membrane protein YkoI